MMGFGGPIPTFNLGDPDGSDLNTKGQRQVMLLLYSGIAADSPVAPSGTLLFYGLFVGEEEIF